MTKPLGPGQYHWTSRIRMTDSLKRLLQTAAKREDQSMAVYIGNVLQIHLTQRSSA